MPATLATVAELMKEVYQPRIREQLNDDTTTLARITRSSANITNETNGKYVTFAVHVRRNSGIGSRYEDEALPTPGQQKHANARVQLKYGYGSVQLTGQAIELTDTDPKAFAKALDTEVNGLKDDLQKDLNRQMYASGAGTIGTIKSVVTSTVIPVDDGRLFQLGETVDVVNLVAGTVAVANRIINSVDLTAGANTVTISGANITTTISPVQIFTRTGSGVGASGNRELTGLGASVAATGAIYNIDPAVEPEWAAIVNSNGGTNRALSEGLMTRVTDDVRTRGGKTTVGFTSLGVRRSYANLLTQTKQTVNTLDFKGGFTGLAFMTDKGEIPIVVDVDAPLNKVWFINEDSYTYYRDQEWHFLDRDGSMWKQFRDSSGNPFDKWYANMAEYHELGVERRNSQGLLSDVTES